MADQEIDGYITSNLFILEKKKSGYRVTCGSNTSGFEMKSKALTTVPYGKCGPIVSSYTGSKTIGNRHLGHLSHKHNLHLLG